MLRALSWHSYRHRCYRILDGLSRKAARNISRALPALSSGAGLGPTPAAASRENANISGSRYATRDELSSDGDVEGGASSSDGELDAEEWSNGVNHSARKNPYTDVTRNYSRHPIAVPRAIVKGIDGVLRGRNLAMLSQHWRDMAVSVEARNLALFKAERLRTKLAEAKSVGSLQDIPASAVTTDSPPLLYGPKETLAHVLHAMLPSYGLAVRVLEDTAAGMPPQWVPRSMLDFGAGPGTATLAARDIWADYLTDACVLVDPSRSMAQVAEHMLAASPGVHVRRSLEEVRRLHKGRAFDLVVAHFALSELPTDKERDAAISDLWEFVSVGGVLVVSDHGHKWGFRVVQRTRDLLLSRAAALARFLPQLLADRTRTTGGAIGPGSRGGVQSLLGSAPGSTAGTAEVDPATLLVQLADTDAGLPPSAPFRKQPLADVEEDENGAFDVDDEAASDEDVGSDSDLDLAALDAAYARQQRSTGRPPLGSPPGQRGEPAALTAVPAPTASALSSPTPPARIPIPSASDVKRQLKAWMKAAGNTLRPPSDTSGTAVVGPCPHALKCPMHETSWCNFGQKVHRHRKAGRSVHSRLLPSHSQAVSWVALRKTGTSAALALEHPPHARSGWAAASAAEYSLDLAASGLQPEVAAAQEAELLALQAAEEEAAATHWRTEGRRMHKAGESASDGGSDDDGFSGGSGGPGGDEGRRRRARIAELQDALNGVTGGVNQLTLTRRHLDSTADWWLENPRGWRAAVAAGARNAEPEEEEDGGEGSDDSGSALERASAGHSTGTTATAGAPLGWGIGGERLMVRMEPAEPDDSEGNGGAAASARHPQQPLARSAADRVKDWRADNAEASVQNWLTHPSLRRRDGDVVTESDAGGSASSPSKASAVAAVGSAAAAFARLAAASGKAHRKSPFADGVVPVVGEEDDDNDDDEKGGGRYRALATAARRGGQVEPGRAAALARGDLVWTTDDDEEEGGDGSDKEGVNGEGEEEEIDEVADSAHRAAALEAAVLDAAARGLPGAGQWARIVRPPMRRFVSLVPLDPAACPPQHTPNAHRTFLHRNRHVILDVCTPQGTLERRIATPAKLAAFPGAYRAARKSEWGALWPNWLARSRKDDARQALSAAAYVAASAASQLPQQKRLQALQALQAPPGIAAAGGGAVTKQTPGQAHAAPATTSTAASTAAALAQLGVPAPTHFTASGVVFGPAPTLTPRGHRGNVSASDAAAIAAASVAPGLADAQLREQEQRQRRPTRRQRRRRSMALLEDNFATPDERARAAAATRDSQPRGALGGGDGTWDPEDAAAAATVGAAGDYKLKRPRGIDVSALFAHGDPTAAAAGSGSAGGASGGSRSNRGVPASGGDRGRRRG